MYTRLLDCNLKLEVKEEFKNALRDQVLPAVRNEKGFVDLVGLLSDERNDHAEVITFWESKGDADRFYQGSAPMMDVLLQFCKERPRVEHFYVETSTLRKTQTGKAA